MSSAKSSADLRKHLDSHNVEDQFTCHIARCPFSARSYSSLALHFKKHHQVRWPFRLVMWTGRQVMWTYHRLMWPFNQVNIIR